MNYFYGISLELDVEELKFIIIGFRKESLMQFLALLIKPSNSELFRQ